MQFRRAEVAVERPCIGWWRFFAAATLIASCLALSCGTIPAVPSSAPDELVLGDQPSAPPDDSMPSDGSSSAQFTIVAIDESDGLTISFSVATLDGQAVPPGLYSWDFGDGATAEGPDVKHIYAIPGTYLITLCATVGATLTTGGCKQKVTLEKSVATKQTPSITGAPVDGLVVTPASGLVSVGPPGGPFTPQSVTYALSNTSASNMTWSAVKSQPWVVLDQTTGSLGANSTTQVVVSIDASVAASLQAGTYSDTVEFNESTDGGASSSSGNARSITLTISTSTLAVAAPTVADQTDSTAGVPKMLLLQATNTAGGTVTFTIPSGPVHGALGAVGQAADLDQDGDVDDDDFVLFDACQSGPTVPAGSECSSRDFDGDGDVDQSDFGIFQRCLSGSDGSACATVLYTPVPGYSGTDSFTFQASNAGGSSNLATFTINVGTLGGAPVANAQSLAAVAGQPLTLTLTGSDPQGLPLTFSITTAPSQGTLGDVTSVSASSASVVYTSAVGYDGADVFSFQASNGISTSSAASVNLTVVPIPTLTIQASPSSGVAPLAVQFTAMDGAAPASALPAGSTLQWNFGDGTATGTGNPVSHTFNAAGNYTVALTLALAGESTLNLAQLAVAVTPANAGADGWTVITPSADSRIIYVSSSQGSDTNSGLSASAPVEMIAKGVSLLRDGYPDWLLVKRGDTFTTSAPPGTFSMVALLNKSGRSATEPLVLSAYGSGPRPILDTPIGGRAITVGSLCSHVSVLGIECTSSQRNPQSPNYIDNGAETAGYFLTSSGNDGFLIEDCKFSYFKDNVNIQGTNGGIVHNVSFRRNVVVNAYSSGGGHSQGIYIAGVENLLLEDNLFDHNGWNEYVSGSGPTIFNHNVYMQYDCSGSIAVRGNISANASSHGMQIRPGGIVSGNLFVHNPIGLLWGNGSGYAESGEVRGNVVLEGSNIDINTPRGFGIDIVNSANMASPVLADGNIIAHIASTSSSAHAISLNQTVGAIVSNSIIYQWLGGIQQTNTTNTTLTNNIIDGPGYPDPNRSVGSYNASLGGASTTNAFLAVCEQQSRQDWDPRYTAAAVIGYIRTGFGQSP